MADFETLRTLQGNYYETGRDKGSNLDSALAIDLAEQVLSHATTADQRSQAQNDLGLALAILGERESGKEHLQLAITAYEEALREHTQARLPLNWTMTQNNLGNALGILGEQEGDKKRLERAVVTYEEALKERTHDQVPLDWAVTKYNLGVLEIAFVDKTADPKHLDQATQHITAAREVFTEAQASHYIAITDNIIANIQSRKS